jgi:hypothetical protein
MTENTDLPNLISAAVAKRLDAGFIEKEIETRVDKLITESIDRALRTYSETAKLIEKAVEDALRVESIDLPSYGVTVAKMVKAAVEHHVAEIVSGRLQQDVEELLHLAPKTVKVSEIAEAMLENHKEEGYGEVTTFIIEEKTHSSRWLYLDDENVYSERDKYRCKFRLMVRDDGTIHCAYIADRDAKPNNWIGRSYGFEQRLRAYVACGTKLEFDTEYPCTSVGDY